MKSIPKLNLIVLFPLFMSVIWENLQKTKVIDNKKSIHQKSPQLTIRQYQDTSIKQSQNILIKSKQKIDNDKWKFNEINTVNRGSRTNRRSLADIQPTLNFHKTFTKKFEKINLDKPKTNQKKEIKQMKESKRSSVPENYINIQ